MTETTRRHRRARVAVEAAPTRDERRAERRAELLAAAVAVIRAEGPAASMEDIAAAAGVTKPILYRHFGDRRGLTHAVADLYSADLFIALRDALLRPVDGRQILAGTIEAYLEFVDRDPQMYRFIVRPSEADNGELAGAALAEFVPRISSEVAVVLGERMRQLGLDSGPAEPWAYGIVGMVHQAADWWVDRRPMPRERLAEYLTTLLWGGLAGAGLDVPVTTS
ncbi:MAG TPA: TetR/AcrR family transcriptional regulator [Acidimicrobiales bacterium]|nr:TetR/AcrR family transcriptional regulator [Acidimicrobiales bacterium]